MHKGLKQLVSTESGPLTYDQHGFDMFHSTGIAPATDFSYFHILPGVGTNNREVIYAGMTNENPYWIAIHNCGTSSGEMVTIQAQSVVGDDLTKNPALGIRPSVGNDDIQLGPGDMIYGKFDQIILRMTDTGSAFVDIIRLIRGI